MSQPILTIQQGKLRGTISKDMNNTSFYSFRGIPYARPPLGKLRFKSPQPPLAWEGIFNATESGSCCYSVDLFKKEFVGSEDCLNLNVYTPALPSKNVRSLPVMVWIHGGGFLCGSNSSDIYGPEFLITGKVVVVTINYRLGLLGFLGLDNPLLGVPGNAGFKDMIMALRWVNSNIKYFNGDPNNVTIFGESAGGVAVHLLMLSPLSRGLFHKAIAQSGCALNPWSRGKKCDENIYKIFGCENKSEEELLEYLQNLPVEKLLQKQTTIDYFIDPNKVNFYGLVIERQSDEQGEEPFLCEEPIDIIVSKKFTDVPFMIGYVKLEGLVVNSYKPKRVVNMLNDFENNVPHFLGYKTGSEESKILGQKIKNKYYENEEPSDTNRHKFYDMVTDNVFLYGIYATVRNHVVNSCSPIYFYRMSIQTSLKFLQVLMKKDTELGTAHADDISYLFKNILTPPLPPDSLEYISIKMFITLWTNFAHYGNPTPENFLPVWRKVSTEQISFLDIGEKLTCYNSFEHDSLNFWDKLYSNSPSGQKFCKYSSKL